MIKQKNKFRIIFTPKSDSALENIIRNFNLEESPEEFSEKLKEEKLSNLVLIDHLTRNFAAQTISEKDLIASLQKDLGVSLQIAKQLSKEIITKIVPFLEKVLEEKIEDLVFMEEPSEKNRGGKKQKGSQSVAFSNIEENKRKPIIAKELFGIIQDNNLGKSTKKLPKTKKEDINKISEELHN